MIRMLGPAIFAAFCCAAFALSLRTGIPYGWMNAFSLAAGSVSLVAMSLCLALAARPRFLEPIFGGLDRMYFYHKWLGITALGMLLLHDLTEPHFQRWVRETALGEIGEGLGEFAYYGLVVLILFSWIKRIPVIEWEIPYQLWWFSHRLTGAFFALASLHQLLVDTPFRSGDPLLILLNVTAAIGIACYVFIEFIAARWRRRAYRVDDLRIEAGATHLALSPFGRAMRWRPGQFAFLSAPAAGLSEPHPFTIAGQVAPDNGVRFIIKPLGDWTRRLPERLQPGTAVAVEGPYGRFNFRAGGRRQIWIAGGVGITPFLAWVQSLSSDEDRRVHLFYCLRAQTEAIGLDILRDAATNLAGFSFELVVSERGKRLDADHVVANAPFDIGAADLFFCGPTNLRSAILSGLKSRGIAPRRVHFELFEFR
ncbi:MAG: ferredoxin reductase family protein [Alphaproteobacteria bacterium]